VQGEAQGTKDALTSFFGYLQTGPSLAVVEKVEKEDIPVIDGEKGFHVRA
jgi:acylphosphatase